MLPLSVVGPLKRSWTPLGAAAMRPRARARARRSRTSAARPKHASRLGQTKCLLSAQRRPQTPLLEARPDVKVGPARTTAPRPCGRPAPTLLRSRLVADAIAQLWPRRRSRSWQGNRRREPRLRRKKLKASSWGGLVSTDPPVRHARGLLRRPTPNRPVVAPRAAGHRSPSRCPVQHGPRETHPGPHKEPSRRPPRTPDALSGSSGPR